MAEVDVAKKSALFFFLFFECSSGSFQVLLSRRLDLFVGGLFVDKHSREYLGVLICLLGLENNVLQQFPRVPVRQGEETVGGRALRAGGRAPHPPKIAFFFLPGTVCHKHHSLVVRGILKKQKAAAARASLARAATAFCD